MYSEEPQLVRWLTLVNPTGADGIELRNPGSSMPALLRWNPIVARRMFQFLVGLIVVVLIFSMAYGHSDGAERLDPRYEVYGVTVVGLAESVNQGVEALLVLKQRGEVVKKNARFRVVRHFADQLLQIVQSNVLPCLGIFSNSFRSNTWID